MNWIVIIWVMALHKVATNVSEGSAGSVGATFSSETLVSHRSTRCHKPGVHSVQLHLCENLNFVNVLSGQCSYFIIGSRVLFSARSSTNVIDIFIAFVHSLQEVRQRLK
jgi:hypothetical protein